MGSADVSCNDPEVCFAIPQWASMTSDAYRRATSLRHRYSYGVVLCQLNQTVLTTINLCASHTIIGTGPRPTGIGSLLRSWANCWEDCAE